MKAARMHEYGKRLVLEDTPIPGFQPNEILVQVQACGMCRSDMRLTELNRAEGQKDLDAIMDGAGAAEMMPLAFSLLAISGHYANVGLVGDRIDIRLFPRVSREHTFHGSFWGNYTDLCEVMSIATEGGIRHAIETPKFDQIKE